MSADPVSKGENVSFRLNGEGHEVPMGTSVAVLLEQLGLPADRVAVEVNREIVRQHLREATKIDAGASIEIVEFVGGG